MMIFVDEVILDRLAAPWAPRSHLCRVVRDVMVSPTDAGRVSGPALAKRVLEVVAQDGRRRAGEPG